MEYIVTSGLVMQLLAGSKIIEVDNSVRENRALLLAKVEFGFGSGGKSKWSTSRLVPIIVFRDTGNVSGLKSRRLRAGNISGPKSRRLHAGNVSGPKSHRLRAGNVSGPKSHRLRAGNVSGLKSRRLRAGNVSGPKSRRLRAGNVSGLKSRRLCTGNIIPGFIPSRPSADEFDKSIQLQDPTLS
ncbi:uncharacterized protein [Gossypium hirsutum]|uniref:Uncharacterized protein isoform X3 n=1 Tax=Gossypium hirsutum TaxID=3635 RepID=A0ABM2ZH51_GOSHI|nr:uncharacterized protein LOC121212714 isoform X3 [Gossypium hirsutum]XP_040941984.1 uncharacterized protein LOC121212714 isoform X3 [Gossypium hirsutum]